MDLFNKFHPPGDDPIIDLPTEPPAPQGQGVNLADLILEQIAAHEAANGSQPDLGGGGPQDAEIPPKVVEVYSKFVRT